MSTVAGHFVGASHPAARDHGLAFFRTLEMDSGQPEKTFAAFTPALLILTFSLVLLHLLLRTQALHEAVLTTSFVYRYLHELSVNLPPTSPMVLVEAE
jgi:hypothetical protein